MHIKIGTRGSKLAIWQTNHIIELLQKASIEAEMVIIETKGDKILDKSLAKIGSKGLFTAELEEQLREKKIDVAIHSAKDVQSTLPDDLELIAFGERENPCDVVVSFNRAARLENFQSGYVLGTSSTRRQALLKHYHSYIRTADARGNLQTRMKRLEQGNYDALILAYAGIFRMNYQKYIIEKLSTDTFTPAVGQGSIAVQSSKYLSDDKKEMIRQCVNHLDTEKCVLAERTFLKVLEGGCSVPVFGLATWQDEVMVLNAGIISLDGQTLLREKQSGENPMELGNQVAEALLSQGADKILAAIR
jgi:hydroxymethylbilane synthase